MVEFSLVWPTKNSNLICIISNFFKLEKFHVDFFKLKRFKFYFFKLKGFNFNLFKKDYQQEATLETVVDPSQILGYDNL